MKNYTVQGKGCLVRVYFSTDGKKIVKCIVKLIKQAQGKTIEIGRYYGKAVCNFDENDIFDMKIGQELALQRALDKYVKQVQQKRKKMEKGRHKLDNGMLIAGLKLKTD